MNTLAERSLRVAMLGYVPDDDPTVIADMQFEIERLRSALHKIGSAYPCSTALAMSRVATDALGITDEQSLFCKDCGATLPSHRPSCPQMKADDKPKSDPT